MEEIIFTKHSLKQIESRGILQKEVIESIRNSKWLDAQHFRFSVTKVFMFNDIWEGGFYRQKEVKVIFKKENDKIIVITSIARYFKE